MAVNEGKFTFMFKQVFISSCFMYSPRSPNRMESNKSDKSGKKKKQRLRPAFISFAKNPTESMGDVPKFFPSHVLYISYYSLTFFPLELLPFYKSYYIIMTHEYRDGHYTKAKSASLLKLIWNFLSDPNNSERVRIAFSHIDHID